ncbi:MFS transporter [Nocardia arthritidis]|nr:MFS transporter [Nocardia arthritidis]
MRPNTSQAPSTALVLTALAAGFGMASLDVSVVNLAGPRIEADLGASLTQLTWIIDGYVLTFSSLLLLAGGLANRFGIRRIYLIGLVLFILASAWCAGARDPGMLIAARMTQGVAAAMFMPSSMALLVNMFPDPVRRAKLLGIWSAMIATTLALGPSLGGFLVNWFGWPSIFLVNLPIGLMGLVLTVRHIPPMPPKDVVIPFRGNVLSIVILSALCFVLIEGVHLGWTAPPILAGLAVAISGGIALVMNERRCATGVMPWEMFRIPEFGGANTIGFLFNFAQFGSYFVLSIYFQQVCGMSPVAAGLALLPMTFAIPFANIFYAWISRRVPDGKLLTICLTTATLGTAGLALVSTPAAAYLLVAVFGCLANLGSGVVSPAMTATLFNAAGVDRSAAAGAALNTNRQIGTLVGIASTGTLLGLGFGTATDVRIAFAVMTVVYLAAIAAAYLRVLTPRRTPVRPAALAR